MTGPAAAPGPGAATPAEPPRVAGAFARLVVRARWAVLAFWACVVLVLLLTPGPGHPGGSGLRGVLSGETPAVQAEKRSVEIFGFPLISRTVVVQRSAAGMSPYAQARTVVRAVAVDRGKAGDVRPVRGALPLTNTRGLFPGSRESSTTSLTYLLFGPETSLGARTRAASRYADRFFTDRDHVVGVTGSAPARTAQGHIIESSLPTVEIATLLAIALIVAVSFRSLVAPVVTAVTAATAYVVTLEVSGYVAAALDLPSPEELEPVVVALLLGIVTDYVVFFCSALRDLVPTRPTPADGHEIAARAITRSAPIVAVAGLSVAAGTGALVAANSPFFRALGPALAFTVVVGLLVAITLVPALLAVLGDRIFWPGRRPTPRRAPGSVWSRLVRVRRPRWPRRVVATIANRRSVAGVVLGCCVTGLLAASLPLLRLDLGVSFVTTLPDRAPVREAATAAQDGFATGILSPTVVLLEGPHVGRQHDALVTLGSAIARQPGVAGVLGPGSQPFRIAAGVLISRDRDAVRYLVVLDREPLGAAAVQAVDRLRSELPTLMREAGLTGATVALGGDTATASFLVHQTQDDLLRIALAAGLANLLMLLLFLRSAVASVLLLGTSVLSLGATLGITSALFGRLDPGQGLTFYVPFAAAVLLLAFGSDYNIFTVGHVWGSARDRSMRDALVGIAAVRPERGGGGGARARHQLRAARAGAAAALPPAGLRRRAGHHRRRVRGAAADGARPADRGRSRRGLAQPPVPAAAVAPARTASAGDVDLAQRLGDRPGGPLAGPQPDGHAGSEIDDLAVLERHRAAAGEHDEHLVDLGVVVDPGRHLPQADLGVAERGEGGGVAGEHVGREQPHESNPSPALSRALRKRLRRPCRWSARSSDRRVSSMPRPASGDGGNGSGRRRTISRRVRSVSSPASRSSITSAANRVAPTPRPVKPAAYATRPRCARPWNAANLVEVSMAPAQRWLNRTPSSCGKTVRKWAASRRYVAGRSSCAPRTSRRWMAS